MLSNEELNTVLAALRAYQNAGYGDPNNRPDSIQFIACPTIDDTSLDDAAIDELCERLNCEYQGVGYVIAGEFDSDDQQQLYWSNSDGWVTLESATVFTEKERNGKSWLPLGYVAWVELPAYMASNELDRARDYLAKALQSDDCDAHAALDYLYQHATK